MKTNPGSELEWNTMIAAAYLSLVFLSGDIYLPVLKMSMHVGSMQQRGPLLI
jgi:hypothetical protein